MTPRLADRLWSGAAAQERCVLAHPFVTGLADGTLPLDRYHFYLRQDYVFLLEYARVLALAVAAAHDPADMDRLAGLLHATLHVEMDLHRRTCAEAGIFAAALEAEEPAPFTFAYTRHLLVVARSEPLGVLVAALLPCQWGYAVIGRTLVARGPSPVAAYAAWIAAYASAEYRENARYVWELTNRVGDVMGPAERGRAEAAFQASFRYERMFWDGCWNGERWPV